MGAGGNTCAGQVVTPWKLLARKDRVNEIDAEKKKNIGYVKVLPMSGEDLK